MMTRGKLWWREEWYSIMSIQCEHETQQEDCKVCTAGSWKNVWGTYINGLFYKLSPKLWRLWMNRPNSKARKQLEGWFPNLRRQKTGEEIYNELRLTLSDKEIAEAYILPSDLSKEELDKSHKEFSEFLKQRKNNIDP